MKQKSSRGFTIVELLVVIVVIGILAAITIVSYSGITAKAKAAKAQSNASSAQTVAEIFYTDTANNGVYPATGVALQGYTTGVAKIPTGMTVANAVANRPNNTDETTVYYMEKADHQGGCIGWYDFSALTIKYVYVGTATTANFATPSCS